MLGCGASKFTRTMFRHNNAEQAAIMAIFTDLEIYSSHFYNNTATKGTKGIFGGFTETKIVDTFFGNV